MLYEVCYNVHENFVVDFSLTMSSFRHTAIEERLCGFFDDRKCEGSNWRKYERKFYEGEAGASADLVYGASNGAFNAGKFSV